MSRFYSLSILDSKTKQPIRGADDQPFGPWTTLLPGGNAAAPFSAPVNPGSLRIKFDIPIISADIPVGGCPITIWGIALPTLYQTAKFNPAPDFSSFCTLSLQAGMSPGLPLANAAFNAGQTGLILYGAIQQAWGNWEGTSQQMDFVVIPVPQTKPPIGSLGTAANPRNFSFTWNPGQSMGVAIANTLTAAFPGVTVNGRDDLSKLLVLPQPSPVQWSIHGTLEQFAQMVTQQSRSIVLGQPGAPTNYLGVKIATTQNGFLLSDGSFVEGEQPGGGLNIRVRKGAKRLAFTDLIGQPVWLDPITLSVKVVLRADIQFGDFVTLPTFKTSLGQNVPIPTATTATSWSQFRDKSAITGTFQVIGIRHMGDSRQASGDSWVTILEMNAQSPQPQAANG